MISLLILLNLLRLLTESKVRELSKQLRGTARGCFCIVVSQSDHRSRKTSAVSYGNKSPTCSLYFHSLCFVVSLHRPCCLLAGRRAPRCLCCSVLYCECSCKPFAMMRGLRLHTASEYIGQGFANKPSATAGRHIVNGPSRATSTSNKVPFPFAMMSLLWQTIRTD